jgi:hypothetical protein
MGIIGGRSQIIDGDHGNIGSLGFGPGPQDQPANPSKPIDSNANRHVIPPEICPPSKAGHILHNRAEQSSAKPLLAAFVQLA